MWLLWKLLQQEEQYLHSAVAHRSAADSSPGRRGGRRGRQWAACRAGFFTPLRDRQLNHLPTPTGPPTPEFEIGWNTIEVGVARQAAGYQA